MTKKYWARLHLLGIPLWKVKKTKSEWKQIAMLEWSKNKVIEYKFEGDDK